MGIQEEKKEFRRIIKKRISELDKISLEKSDESIYHNVLELPEVKKAEQILLYCSMGSEIDTRRLIEIFLSEGKRLGLPLCLDDTSMVFKEIGDSKAPEAGMYGILEPPQDADTIEPEDGDLIIVPSLAYDKEGYRIGKGKGYYDRYLARYKLMKIGLTRDCLTVDAVPREFFDSRVDILISETRIVRFDRVKEKPGESG